MLLPSIRALGNPDEDEAIIFGGEGNAEEGFAGAAGARAIGPLERRLALMRLVLRWSDVLRQGAIASPEEYGPPPVSTPAQASYLAADLGTLMDFIESEEVDLSALEDLGTGGIRRALGTNGRFPKDRHRALAGPSCRAGARVADRAPECAHGFRG